VTALGGSIGTWTRLVAIAIAVAFALYLLQFGARLFDPAIGPLSTDEPWWRIGHVVAGALLLASGIGALAVKTLWRSGTLAVVAAVTWFGPDLARFEVAPLPVRAAGVAIAVLFLPVLSHLLVATMPAHSAKAPIRTLTLGIVDIFAIVVAGAVLLTYAPFYDAQCAETCAFPKGLLAAGATERGIMRDAVGAVTVAAGGMLVLAAARWTLSERSAATWLRVILAGAILAGLAGAAVGVVWTAPQLQSIGTASIDASWVILPALTLGTAAMASGLVLRAADLGLAPRRIRRLADGLVMHPASGSLEGSLSTALDDPRLQVAYLSDGGQTLTADGTDVDLAGLPGLTVTSLTREGRAIALVRHRSDIGAEALRGAFRPSLLLALDYERLRALRLSTLRELQSSRARIVELGDAERRRIERDLHDGAQQRLLAIAFDLRLASATARRDGRVEAAVRLEDGAAQALALVEELRQLCRGIHPQVLSQAGLPAALAALADESGIPVEVSVALDERPPLAVETAAYELVVDALGQGVARGSSALAVRISHDADEIVVEAAVGTPDEPEVRTRLADRIGAVGGALSAGVSTQGGYLRAVLPCA
jgi:signal transduction histidine kinase